MGAVGRGQRGTAADKGEEGVGAAKEEGVGRDGFRSKFYFALDLCFV